MPRLLLLGAALAAVLPATGLQARGFDVPAGVERPQAPPPDFRTLPQGEDLRGRIQHLGSCIADPSTPRSGAPNIDQFVLDLEGALRQGNDVPRDRILRNAAVAREALRLAYNDLTEADSPELLPRVRDELKAVGDALPPLLDAERANVTQLVALADAGQATAGAIQVEPPESPGPELPLYRLDLVVPLLPRLLPLRERLTGARKRLAAAKGYIARAKERAAAVRQLAERAGALDEDALGHLDDRRTLGTREQYRTQMLSREVILDADRWLEDAVKRSEQAEQALERQADPRLEGVRKALEAAAQADRLAQDGKELETRSGRRIDFNHTMRLNGVIQHGYEVATDARKPWWVGRARMAESECGVDAGKMRDAAQAAAEAGRAADAALRAARDAMERLDAELGPSADHLPRLKQLRLDVPPPRDEGGKPVASGEKPRSKALKVPHTFQVSDQEILGSYDGGQLRGGR